MNVKMFRALGKGIITLILANGLVNTLIGIFKFKKTNKVNNVLNDIDKMDISFFEEKKQETIKQIDKLGKLELNIQNNFIKFSNLIEKIQGRPQINEFKLNNTEFNKYKLEELKKVSIGTEIIITGLSGAALGTTGTFAAIGTVKAAVTALGNSSTGTPIRELKGPAATNAILAKLGGGPIADGGGGKKLGKEFLNKGTFAIGLAIFGKIFEIKSEKELKKAWRRFDQTIVNGEKIHKLISYLDELKTLSSNYNNLLEKVNQCYEIYYRKLDNIINNDKKNKWDDFLLNEKKIVENLVLLVGLLYNMCKVNLIIKYNENKELNDINNKEIIKTMAQANNVLKSIN